jgi:type II restriction enzyme
MLDMWTNFGPAVQVKHLSLSDELAEDISGSIAADRIIIVCKDAEKDTIYRVCHQLGISERIQGIITKSDLIRWYNKALRGKFSNILAKELLLSLKTEFTNEFPYSRTFKDFYRGRRYHLITESRSPFYENEGEANEP